MVNGDSDDGVLIVFAEFIYGNTFLIRYNVIFNPREKVFCLHSVVLFIYLFIFLHIFMNKIIIKNITICSAGYVVLVH